MLRQIITPTAEQHTIRLPREFYGKKIEVIAFEVDLVSDIRQDQISQTEKVAFDSIDSFYDSIRQNFDEFKFDRDEANSR